MSNIWFKQVNWHTKKQGREGARDEGRTNHLEKDLDIGVIEYEFQNNFNKCVQENRWQHGEFTKDVKSIKKNGYPRTEKYNSEFKNSKPGLTSSLGIAKEISELKYLSKNIQANIRRPKRKEKRV